MDTEPPDKRGSSVIPASLDSRPYRRFLIESAGRTRLCARSAPPAVPKVLPVRCGLARRSSPWWDPRLPRGTGEVLPAAATIRAGRPHLPSVRAYARSWAAGTRRMSRTGTAGRLDHTAATAEQAARLTGVRAAAAGARPWRPSSRCLTWPSRPRRARTGRIPSRAATCPAGPGTAAARIHAKQPLTEQGQVE
jgi:hypothetical protein